MLKHVITDLKITIEALKAADNETLTGAGVDMQGYEGVAFVIAVLKGEAKDLSIKAQQDTASNFGTTQDLLGTAVTVSPTVAADAIKVLDVYRPAERYVRALVTVPDMAAATPTCVIAIRYNGRYHPDASTLPGELHVSPIEGTA